MSEKTVTIPVWFEIEPVGPSIVAQVFQPAPLQPNCHGPYLVELPIPAGPDQGKPGSITYYNTKTGLPVDEPAA